MTAEGFVRNNMCYNLYTGGPSDIRQHHARFLTGGGVNVVVAEENLRCRGAGSTVLGHVVGSDVDCGGGRLFDHLDLCCLAVGTAHTFGLTFGGLNDQEDSAVVGKSLVQLEGKGFTLAHDGGRGRVLYSHENGRGGLRRAAVIHGITPGIVVILDKADKNAANSAAVYGQIRNVDFQLVASLVVGVGGGQTRTWSSGPRSYLPDNP